MKRIVIIFLVLGFAIQNTMATRIDTRTAKIVAKNFYLQQKPHGDKSTLEVKLAQTYATILQNSTSDYTTETPLFYVYNINNDKGFVIVTADDNISPILGYSTAGSFSGKNLPPALSEFLENYKNEITYILLNNLQADNKTKSKWSRLKNSESLHTEKKLSGVSPLLTTSWDQSTYYNALCPFDPGQNQLTLTGCVATAMAQIMKYWDYPAQGIGFHSYVHPKYGTLSANFAATTYNWSAMPDNVTSPNVAVATLMYYCGVSVDMDYGVDASGAYMSAVVYALKTYFQYSNNVENILRANFNYSDWTGILKLNLDSGYPINYSGHGPDGGHSFVCDGYDNNDYFHFNWGWSGYYDGYFDIDNLNPATYTWNDNQAAIINIVPASGGTPKVTFRVDMTGLTVSTDGVHIAGNFQGWDPSATSMTSLGGNIYAYTIELVSGTQAEYKFINGITWGQVENVPSICGLPPDGNRFFTVPGTPLKLPAVCFSSCSPWSTNVDVTFTVDMTGQTVSPDGVHIAGNFQDWDPSASLMLLQQGNIYSFPTSLLPGTQAEYKFINGNNWDQVEAVPSSCGLPPNSNRYITVPAVNMSLSPIRFGICELNSINEPAEETANTLTLYPNPSSGKFTITSLNAINSIEIYNENGVWIYGDYKVHYQTLKEVDLSNFPKGIYLVKVYDGKNLQTGKIVVQ
jgi:hypothetical protein